MGQVQNHMASWKTSWFFYLRNSCISDMNFISILSHCPEMLEISLFHRLSRLPGYYVYFLSHAESIFSLNNYCQSWIRTCQSCRKEFNSFLQSKYELALLVFVLILSVNNLAWMNPVKAWYIRNLWADPQLVYNRLQKSYAQLHPEDASLWMWKALLEIIHLIWMQLLPSSISFWGFWLLSQRTDNSMGLSASN